MVNEVKKVEIRPVEVLDHKEIICDCCGKLIYPVIDKNKRSKYYHVRTGHEDWGNDSIESYKYLDLCSLECLHKQLDKFYTKDESNSTTAYFEIEAELTPFN